MTTLRLTTAVKRRFRSVERQDELKLGFVSDTPGMENRMLRLEQSLLTLAIKGVQMEYRFWMNELMQKHTLSPHALTVIVRRLRLLNSDLPSDLQDPNLEIVLEQRVKRHMRLNAHALIRQLYAETSPSKTHELRRQIRDALKRAGATLEDVGSSQKELRAVIKTCWDTYYKESRERRAAARAARQQVSV
ncbi:MAG: hypothetical protein AAB582_03330 [Patescibacteria group bacterium]